MLRKTCLLSCDILPVCIAFDVSCTGVTDHIVFVFNKMHPPPAIKPCKREASEDKLRLSILSLWEAKRKGFAWGEETQAQNVPVLVGSLIRPAPSVVCG